MKINDSDNDIPTNHKIMNEIPLKPSAMTDIFNAAVGISR